VPDFGAAVDAFDIEGTLFGEHRYQLQVGKTANMLIATEALRASLEGIQARLDYIRANGEDNYEDIDWNLSVLRHTRQILEDNEDELRDIEHHIHDIEEGYDYLHELLAIDRNILVMMCHQYAYAEEIPHECECMIGNLSAPLSFAWDFPTASCPDNADLPPFHNPRPVFEVDEYHSDGDYSDFWDEWEANGGAPIDTGSSIGGGIGASA
jgi:transcription termination factor NusB